MTRQLGSLPSTDSMANVKKLLTRDQTVRNIIVDCGLWIVNGRHGIVIRN